MGIIKLNLEQPQNAEPAPQDETEAKEWRLQRYRKSLEIASELKTQLEGAMDNSKEDDERQKLNALIQAQDEVIAKLTALIRSMERNQREGDAE